MTGLNYEDAYALGMNVNTLLSWLMGMRSSTGARVSDEMAYEAAGRLARFSHSQLGAGVTEADIRNGRPSRGQRAALAEARSMVSRVVVEWPELSRSGIEAEREVFRRWLDENPHSISAALDALRGQQVYEMAEHLRHLATQEGGPRAHDLDALVDGVERLCNIILDHGGEDQG